MFCVNESPLRDSPRFPRREMYEEMSAERNWTDTETRALLYIRQDDEISRQISGTVRDSLIYAEISRLLRAQGIHRTKRQVTTKLKTLKQKFLKIHEHHKNSGHGRVYWNYYDLCRSIWGGNRPTNTLNLQNSVKLEEPQSTSIEDARNESTSTDVELSISHDAETDDTAEVVAQPVRKKAKKHPITDSARDQEPVHVQSQREYEERLRREAREEQKEEQASLMAMWKEMMEFQGNLLREFIHRPSLPSSLPSHPSYHRHAHHNQGRSTFPSTSYMTAYASPGAETENESAFSQDEEDEEEEEQKYIIPAEIAPVLDAQLVNSQSHTAETASSPPTLSAGKSDLEMSVLRRQERVLELQEEYYSLKIKYLKDKMAKDSGQSDKEEAC